MQANNRQLHEDGKAKEKTLAKKLAAQSNGKYTQAQIEDALRAANNNALGEDVNTGTIVGGAIHGKVNPTTVYDQGASWSVNSINGVALNLVQNIPSQVDSSLAAYIQSNTGNTYSWNDSTLGKVPTNIVKQNTSPFDQMWNKGNHSAGFTPDTTPEQRLDSMVKFTDMAATGLGTASIWAPPPYNIGAAALAAAFKSTNYLLSPTTVGNIWFDTGATIIPAAIPQGNFTQTGFAIVSSFLQPFITPILDKSVQKSSCTPPKKC